MTSSVSKYNSHDGRPEDVAEDNRRVLIVAPAHVIFIHRVSDTSTTDLGVDHRIDTHLSVSAAKTGQESCFHLSRQIISVEP